jgi:hypothetical protein
MPRKDFKFFRILEGLFVFVINSSVYSPLGNRDSSVYSSLGSHDSPDSLVYSPLGSRPKFLYKRTLLVQNTVSVIKLARSSKIIRFFKSQPMRPLSTNIAKQKKKIDLEVQKKCFFENFQKKSFFWKDFLDFLLFYLTLGLSPHIHLFFQLSSCTGWSTIRDF